MYSISLEFNLLGKLRIWASILICSDKLELGGPRCTLPSSVFKIKFVGSWQSISMIFTELWLTDRYS